MVSVDGQVLLADFGVAAIESPEPQTSIRGTAAYMSPEQARGRPVDAGTDLFSLGVVLYELVSGRRPFDGDGDDPASLERLGRCEYPPLKSIVPDTSDALITVITRLLQKKRDERYKSAREAVSAFSAIAPSHDVVQRLGDLSRAARRRETKPYSTLQLPGRIQTAVLHFAIPARDPQAHEVTTVVRPTPDSDSAWTVPTNYGSRRVHQRAIAAAIAAALIAVMFFVWPMSRSRSSSGGEVMRNAASSLPPTLKISPPALARVAGEGVVSGSGLAEGTPPRVQPDEVVASTTGGTSPPAASENVATEQGPEDATIKVSADKSARVRIDGRFAGWSPLKSSLEPGKHTILIGEGAQQQTIKTQVAAGDTKEFFVKIRHPKN
jgi:hypothetical protein